MPTDGELTKYATTAEQRKLPENRDVESRLAREHAFWVDVMAEATWPMRPLEVMFPAGVSQSDPVNSWTADGILTALEAARPDLWDRIAEAALADAAGVILGQIREVIEFVPWRDAVEQLRERLVGVEDFPGVVEFGGDHLVTAWELKYSRRWHPKPLPEWREDYSDDEIFQS